MITKQHIDLANDARELALSLAAMAAFVENKHHQKKIYEAVKTITALADLYEERKK